MNQDLYMRETSGIVLKTDGEEILDNLLWLTLIIPESLPLLPLIFVLLPLIQEAPDKAMEHFLLVDYIISDTDNNNKRIITVYCLILSE